MVCTALSWKNGAVSTASIAGWVLKRISPARPKPSRRFALSRTSSVPQPPPPRPLLAARPAPAGAGAAGRWGGRERGVRGGGVPPRAEAAVRPHVARRGRVGRVVGHAADADVE